MLFNAAAGPYKVGLVVLVLSAGLLSCGESPEDTKAGDASVPAGEASETDPVATVRYPEFDRQQRVERIVAMAADTETGARAFETCASCHGVDGFGSRDGQVPRLAGQLRPVLAEKLVEISDGIRHREQMEPFLTRIDEDKEIAALSGYIAALPDPGDIRHGAGIDLKLGEETYGKLCASCHGGDGRGDGDGHIPRIAGWDAPSITRTLVILGADYSEVHEAGMSDLVSMMTEPEIKAVADYVSRLAPGAPGSP